MALVKCQYNDTRLFLLQHRLPLDLPHPATDMRPLLALAALALCFSLSSALFRRNLFPSTAPANQFAHFPENASPASALYLTPYIEAGKLAEGRQLSQVTSLPGNGPQIQSYSGFLTVNQTYNSNLFFWFFPALVCNLSKLTKALS